MNAHRTFAYVAFVVTMLAVISAGVLSPLASARGSDHRPDLIGWLGVGPRLTDGGYMGGSQNFCTCNTVGAKNCPNAPGRTCNPQYQYSGCITDPFINNGQNWNYCVFGGNCNYCGQDGCGETCDEACSGDCGHRH
jgi:hypothetical protein